MEIKEIVKPIAGFEEDYNKYVERKAQVEEEVKKEFEQVLADRTKILDELISIVSETVIVEVEEEVDADVDADVDAESEDPNDYVGI